MKYISVQQGESWKQAAVFSRSEFEPCFYPTVQSIEREAIGRSGFEEHYGGPGQTFARRPTVTVMGSRVLVRQRGGYDI